MILKVKYAISLHIYWACTYIFRVIDMNFVGEMWNLEGRARNSELLIALLQPVLNVDD